MRSVKASEDAFAPAAAFIAGRDVYLQTNSCYVVSFVIFVVFTVLHIDVYAIQNVRVVFQCSEAAAGGHLLF